MKSIPVLLNSGGGGVASDSQAAETVSRAFSEAGLDAEIEVVAGSAIEGRCRSLAERGESIIAVGGGDGTVSCAAAAVAGSDARLAVLPLGTLNHFARDLGIPLKLDEAARVVAAGATRQIDVAELNGRVFVNNSAVGIYPLMVVNRDLQRRKLGRSKRLAMLVASIRTLARFNHQRLTLIVNDRRKSIDTPLLFVGNNSYRLDFAAPGRRESLTGGRLFVLVMRSKTRRGLVAATVRALFRRPRADDMVQLEDVTTLRVESRRKSLPVSMDGEVVRLEPPLEYRIRPKALTVVVPADE